MKKDLETILPIPYHVYLIFDRKYSKYDTYWKKRTNFQLFDFYEIFNGT